MKQKINYFPPLTVHKYILFPGSQISVRATSNKPILSGRTRLLLALPSESLLFSATPAVRASAQSREYFTGAVLIQMFPGRPPQAPARRAPRGEPHGSWLGRPHASAQALSGEALQLPPAWRTPRDLSSLSSTSFQKLPLTSHTDRGSAVSILEAPSV